MKAPQEAMIAYLGTLLAIVLLAIGAAIIAVFVDIGSEKDMARILGALGFIASAITGLVGVIGTFRPKGHDDRNDAGHDGDKV